MQNISRAIEPFAVLLMWAGAWELIYTSNPTINLIYVIVGYIGELWLPQTFVWSVFFSAGSWAMLEPLKIQAGIALAISLPIVIYLEWKQRRQIGTVERMGRCVIM